MTHHLKLANSEAPPRQLGDHAMTETANNIRRSLDLLDAVEGGAMTMISGAPGVGKTMALKAYMSETSQTHSSSAFWVGVPRSRRSAMQEPLSKVTWRKERSS